MSYQKQCIKVRADRVDKQSSWIFVDHLEVFPLKVESLVATPSVRLRGVNPQLHTKELALASRGQPNNLVHKGVGRWCSGFLDP